MLNQQTKEPEEEILKYYKTFNCYLHTVPSVSPIIAACILSEIGDIRRFRSSAALVAYAGIDPTVKNHLSAAGAASNKLTTIIYAILRDGKPYEPVRYVSQSVVIQFNKSPMREA